MSRKNFVWLVVDSIRGDHTSLGGHRRETTPTLERLGAEAESVGTTCLAHAIWSQPSVASMLTGTPPSRHGAGLHNDRIPPQIPTVAERLSDTGYRSSGLSTNPFVSEVTGCNRGFDEFDYLDVGEMGSEVGLRGLLRFVGNLRRFSGGFSPTKRKHSPDFLFNEIVTDRLRALADTGEPFFFFGHYHGVHHPYYPAPAYRRRFFDGGWRASRRAAQFAYDRTTDVYAEIGAGCPYSETEWEWIRRMYDAQVAQIDGLIDRFVRSFDSMGLDENTVLVITSDHGDFLGEQNLLSHKLVPHDALLRVPLVIRNVPSLVGTDFTNVQHVDVMQKLLTELGADTSGMCGRELNDGGPEFAVAQRGGETRERTLGRIRETVSDFDHPTAQAGLVSVLRTPEWKYSRGSDSAALYQLPDEETDHATTEPARVARLDGRLESWLEEYGTPEYTSDAADFDDVSERLADLGYVTG
jgi:arylsulfatase A-like enzyme